MIIPFITSFIVTACFFVLWTDISGGALFMYSYSLYLFMLACTIPFLFMNKNYVSFSLLFSGKKRFLNCSIEQYKNLNSFISFVIKAEALFTLFFISIASINLFFNLDNKMLLGPNLATVFEAPLFALMFAIVFIPLQTRAKLFAISSMEDIENKNASKTQTNINIFSTVKIIFITVWAIVCFIFLYFVFTKNDKASPVFYDLPSVLPLVVFFVSFLLISGSIKDFSKALSFVFTRKKINISEQAKYSETICGLVKQMLCVGAASFFIACMGILCNLENLALFGKNYNVAIMTFIYSVFLSIILEVIQSIISHKK